VRTHCARRIALIQLNADLLHRSGLCLPADASRKLLGCRAGDRRRVRGSAPPGDAPLLNTSASAPTKRVPRLRQTPIFRSFVIASAARTTTIDGRLNIIEEKNEMERMTSSTVSALVVIAQEETPRIDRVFLVRGHARQIRDVAKEQHVQVEIAAAVLEQDQDAEHV
jgi:hypothetical protein